MSKPKEPTLFRVKLLQDTAYNYAGDILDIKTVDANGCIYYYDTYHRWCYLEYDDTLWKRLPDKPVRNRRGIWISPDEEMPKVMQGDVVDRSEAVLIKGKDGCMWLAIWDGEVWRNANTSDEIWFNKDYTIRWMKIPKE